MREGKALVPKLRFPAFRQTGGWTPKRLKDACEVNPANSALPEKFVYIDLESVQAGKLTARKTITRDEAPSRAQRLLHPDDVIFQIVRPYQRNNFHFKGSEGLDYVASTGYAQLRAKDSADFLFQSIHVDSFVERVIAKCTGSSYPAINSSDLAEVPVAIPTPGEQQKIADCLSSLDELIAAQAHKVDALKTHKKGLMKQLFPREGETQPRLRFSEFQDARQWVGKTLGDVCQMQAGKFVPASDIRVQHAKGLFPCYGGNGLRGFTQRYTHEGTYPLIGRQGALCGNIKLSRNKFHATEHAVVVTSALGVAVVWLYYLLDVLNLNRFATGQAQPGLSVDVLEKVIIAIPKEEGEQHRIADCLTSLDVLITAATQELESLKTHKKGLMHQLFPTAESVEV